MSNGIFSFVSPMAEELQAACDKIEADLSFIKTLLSNPGWTIPLIVRNWAERACTAYETLCTLARTHRGREEVLLENEAFGAAFLQCCILEVERHQLMGEMYPVSTDVNASKTLN